MKIYTKQGDTGSTQVYTSTVMRLSKDNIILQCYGDLDELNSHLGLLAAQILAHPLGDKSVKLNKDAVAKSRDVESGVGERAVSENGEETPAQLLNAKRIQAIQEILFKIGFAISDKPQIDMQSVNDLELAIDSMQAILPPQTSFILPGGSIIAAQAHVCRAITRRAERSIVALSAAHDVPEICQQYLNRLSDYLFVCARYANQLDGINDIKV